MSRQTPFADPGAVLVEAQLTLEAPSGFLTLAEMSDEMLETLRQGIADWAADDRR